MSARGAVVLVYLAGPISAAHSLLYRTSRNRKAPLNTTAHIPPSLQRLLIRLTYALSPSPIIGVRISVLRGLWSTFFVIAIPSIPNPISSSIASLRAIAINQPPSFFPLFFFCLRLRSRLAPKSLRRCQNSDYLLAQRLCACSNRQQQSQSHRKKQQTKLHDPALSHPSRA
jgi:hypothetical protein